MTRAPSLQPQKKIIVADDDPAIADALKTMLEDEGYAIEIVRDGVALADRRAPAPDLILLDISMPGMDGAAICRLLKHRSETRQIPIIMISANRDTKAIAREAGADDFIEKPFDIDDLMTLIAKHL